MNYNYKNCGLKELNMGEEVEIGGYFDCSENPNLVSLKGGPSKVGRGYSCNDCNLIEFGMDSRVEIRGNFSCFNNPNLTSLKNGPKRVIGNYNCNLKEIDLDEGIYIGNDIICLLGNKVTSEQVKKYIDENNIVLKGNIR